MRLEYLEYLNSHIEFEHIELDSFEMFGTTIFEHLATDSLKKLSELYGFNVD